MNSAAIIKESREILPKTIQTCIQKSKLESIQQLQIYINDS